MGYDYNSASDKNNYKNLLELGNMYQDFIMSDLLKQGIVLMQYSSKKYQYEAGESLSRIEVKFDDRCTETNRLSIEIGEKQIYATKYERSGIFRNDNSLFYVQGNLQKYFFFSKKTLKRYFLQNMNTINVENYPTLKKFYLNFEIAEDLCEFSVANTI